VIKNGDAAARFAKARGVSLAEAARRFGISRERVRQKWRVLFGDEPTPIEVARKRREKKIADLADRGLSISEIASLLGSAPHNVHDFCDRRGIATVSGHDKISTTRETKAKILALARAGKGRAEIAHETGANYGTVAKQLKGYSTRGMRDPRCRSAMASDVMDRTGCSLGEAAAMFVVPPPALYGYRKRRGLWTTKR
jgi:DNA-binding CsgD family transcriptional regulator